MVRIINKSDVKYKIITTKRQGINTAMIEKTEKLLLRPLAPQSLEECLLSLPSVFVVR